MIAKLSYGNNVFGLLSYNEEKVKSGTAKLIDSANFSKDFSALSFAEKNQEFKNFTDLNKRVKKNAYHFVLSFSEKERVKLDSEKMRKIAKSYLDGL